MCYDFQQRGDLMKQNYQIMLEKTIKELQKEKKYNLPDSNILQTVFTELLVIVNVVNVTLILLVK